MGIDCSKPQPPMRTIPPTMLDTISATMAGVYLGVLWAFTVTAATGKPEDAIAWLMPPVIVGLATCLALIMGRERREQKAIDRWNAAKEEGEASDK